MSDSRCRCLKSRNRSNGGRTASLHRRVLLLPVQCACVLSSVSFPRSRSSWVLLNIQFTQTTICLLIRIIASSLYALWLDLKERLTEKKKCWRWRLIVISCADRNCRHSTSSVLTAFDNQQTRPITTQPCCVKHHKNTAAHTWLSRTNCCAQPEVNLVAIVTRKVKKNIYI